MFKFSGLREELRSAILDVTCHENLITIRTEKYWIMFECDLEVRGPGGDTILACRPLYKNSSDDFGVLVGQTIEQLASTECSLTLTTTDGYHIISEAFDPAHECGHFVVGANRHFF